MTHANDTAADRCARCDAHDGAPDAQSLLAELRAQVEALRRERDDLRTDRDSLDAAYMCARSQRDSALERLDISHTCRLANEAELRRADALVGDLRARAEQAEASAAAMRERVRRAEAVTALLNADKHAQVSDPNLSLVDRVRILQENRDEWMACAQTRGEQGCAAEDDRDAAQRAFAVTTQQRDEAREALRNLLAASVRHSKEGPACDGCDDDSRCPACLAEEALLDARNEAARILEVEP